MQTQLQRAKKKDDKKPAKGAPDPSVSEAVLHVAHIVPVLVAYVINCPFLTIRTASAALLDLVAQANTRALKETERKKGKKKKKRKKNLWLTLFFLFSGSQVRQSGVVPVPPHTSPVISYYIPLDQVLKRM